MTNRYTTKHVRESHNQTPHLCNTWTSCHYDFGKVIATSLIDVQTAPVQWTKHDGTQYLTAFVQDETKTTQNRKTNRKLLKCPSKNKIHEMVSPQQPAKKHPITIETGRQQKKNHQGDGLVVVCCKANMCVAVRFIAKIDDTRSTGNIWNPWTTYSVVRCGVVSHSHPCCMVRKTSTHAH